MPTPPTVDEICALLGDRSWGPPGTSSVRRAEIDFGVCPQDLLELNSVTRVDPIAAHPEALIAEVLAAHRGRRSRWNLPRSMIDEAMAGALERAGYRRLYTVAMALEVPAAPEPAPLENVVDRVGLRDWHGLRVAAGRSQRLPDEASLQAELRLGAGGRYRPVLLRAGGRAIAAGGLTLYPGAGLLWGGATAPDARGRGAYRALVRGRVAMLAAMGVARAWTVTIEGAAQRALASVGFTDVAPYFTFERDAADQP